MGMTPIEKLVANHMRKYDHTDMVDRCSKCGRFLSKDRPERFVCECGKTHFNYTPKA